MKLPASKIKEIRLRLHELAVALPKCEAACDAGLPMREYVDRINDAIKMLTVLLRVGETAEMTE